VNLARVPEGLALVDAAAPSFASYLFPGVDRGTMDTRDETVRKDSDASSRARGGPDGSATPSPKPSLELPEPLMSARRFDVRAIVVATGILACAAGPEAMAIRPERIDSPVWDKTGHAKGGPARW
jgi:hypothetical protein